MVSQIARYDIEFLTPCFNRGASQNKAEIRESSIRGMVRWWFRQLGGTPHEEKNVFGGLKRFAGTGKVQASRVVFRLTDVQAQAIKSDTLPHKQGGQASPQAAFKEGGGFQLTVLARLGGLDEYLRSTLLAAIDVWTLLGSLGLRANRGGGSLWPKTNPPNTPSELRQRLTDLQCFWPVYLAGIEVGSSLTELRKACTDTVKEPRAIFGSAQGSQRQASRIKFKIVRLDNMLRLLIAAPNEEIIGTAQTHLKGHRCKPETWRPL